MYQDGLFGGMVVKGEIDLKWSKPIMVDGEEKGTWNYDLTGRVEGNKMSGKYHSKIEWGVGTLAVAARNNIPFEASEEDGQWMATKE